MSRKCQAQDPTTCWKHGNPISKPYDEAAEKYAETGVLPRVLFQESLQTLLPSKTVELSATITEFSQDIDGDSYGFPAYPNEPNIELTAWVEVPTYLEGEENKTVEYLENRIATEPNEYMKARYQNILNSVQEPNGDTKIMQLASSANRLSTYLYQETGFETSPSDAKLLYEYASRIDTSNTVKNDLDKALILAESLKKIGQFEEDYEFGTPDHKQGATGAWKIYKAYDKNLKAKQGIKVID